MPSDYQMYEYEYESNNSTQLEARSRVPTSPGEINDEIDTLCEENPKECAKKHLNLMGFRQKLKNHLAQFSRNSNLYMSP